MHGVFHWLITHRGRLNRRYIIIGSVVTLTVLVIAGVAWLRSVNQPARAGHRILITKLAYCSAEGIRPCVVSFSQDETGNMLVEILIPSSAFPRFYLTISREGQAYRYECEKAKNSLTDIYCTGQEMFPGELLQFTLVANRDKHVLAEGQFVIIGLLLSTPLAEVIEPPALTETSTPMLLEVLTPVSTVETPTVTMTPSPSYPNPSYPTP